MINKLLEYITMKWLLDGWKYVLTLVLTTLASYVAYPYVIVWLYGKGYTISWVGLMLVVILLVTLVSFIAMFYNAVSVDPKVGKTDFSKRK